MLLAQGSELIARLGAERYDQKVPACFNSAAGGHFRHVIEHYQSLLAATATGRLDYTERARDLRIETQADVAREALDELMAGLQGMMERKQPDQSLRVVSETAPSGEMGSSLSRELEFLLSHTVHHYALIAVIAGHHGVVPPVNFGMAPSTLKFQQEQAAACAP